MPRVSERTATIVGLGLIGGSIAMALRREGWTVRFVDPTVSADDARAAGAADDAGTSERETDIVVIATPVNVAIEQAGSIRSTALVTSVCSVMRALRDSFPPEARAVAGHPFAGSESRGLAAARADLFADRTWFLDDTPMARELEPLVAACGANVYYIDADAHDRAMALTSHLPQVLATSLASIISGHPELTDEFLGSGLASILRLAGSSAEVWQPVIESNADAIASASDELTRAIARVVGGDSAADFINARETWQRLRR